MYRALVRCLGFHCGRRAKLRSAAPIDADRVARQRCAVCGSDLELLEDLTHTLTQGSAT